MNIVDRIKNILLTPKTEWLVIDNESATPTSLLKSYVLPLSLIGTIAGFIGYGLIGINMFFVKVSGIDWGLYYAISYFVSTIVSFFISTYVLDALAPTFKAEKNINKSAQLVAYASTASYLAAVFSIIPSLAILAILGIYSIYIFYVGFPVMKKTTEDQKIPYLVVSVLVIIIVTWLANFILHKILGSILNVGYSIGNIHL